MNLKKLREYNMQIKFIETFKRNLHRLKQAEQDVINLVCYPKIALLPMRAMVCTYLYDIYKQKNLIPTDKAMLKEVLKDPIQIHYAGAQKPWNLPSCTQSKLWYSFLVKTPFFTDVMQFLQENFCNLALNNTHKYYFGGIEMVKIKENKARLFGFISLYEKKRR